MTIQLPSVIEAYVQGKNNYDVFGELEGESNSTLTFNFTINEGKISRISIRLAGE